MNNKKIDSLSLVHFVERRYKKSPGEMFDIDYGKLDGEKYRINYSFDCGCCYSSEPYNLEKEKRDNIVEYVSYLEEQLMIAKEILHNE